MRSSAQAKKLTKAQLKKQTEEELANINLESNTWKAFHAAMNKSGGSEWVDVKMCVVPYARAHARRISHSLPFMNMVCLHPPRHNVPGPIKERYDAICQRPDGERTA